MIKTIEYIKNAGEDLSGEIGQGHYIINLDIGDKSYDATFYINKNKYKFIELFYLEYDEKDGFWKRRNEILDEKIKNVFMRELIKKSRLKSKF